MYFYKTMCEFSTILQLYYNTSDILSFQNNYKSTLSNFVGTSVKEEISIASLYNSDDTPNGNIQFNNINVTRSTFPAIYKVTESISFQFDENTQIFISNYYQSNTEYYPTGSKYIIPIISCTGKYLGREGYVVIDAESDKRYITIGLY